MNEFRKRDGRLDRVYLRVCAIWRLLKSHRIDWTAAKAYAARPIKGVHGHNVLRTVEVWQGSALCAQALDLPRVVK